MRRVEEHRGSEHIHSDQEGVAANLREYVRVLWRKKWYLLIPLAIALGVVQAGVRYLVPIYESRSLVKIASTGSTDATVDDILGISRSSRGARAKQVAQETEAFIKSNQFLDAVIHELGMDRDPQLHVAAQRQREKLHPGISTDELVMLRLRNFLSGRIAVQLGPTTELFYIVYADANPEACHLVADAITQLYIERRDEETSDSFRKAREIALEQLPVAEERLRQAKRELTQFQLSQVKTDQGPITDVNLATAQLLRQDIQLEISKSNETLSRMRQRLSEFVTAIPSRTPVWNDNEFSAALRTLKSTRERELRTELLGGVPNAEALVPARTSLNRRLNDLVGANYTSINADVHPFLQEYFFQTADLEGQQHKLNQLNAWLSQYDASKNSSPVLSIREQELAREVERAQGDVDRNRDILENVEGREGMEEQLTRVEVVETANKPLDPVHPNKIKIMVVAVMLGMVLGGGTLLLTEYTDSSFRTVEEVEKHLGLKVLGTVPRFDDAPKGSEGRAKRVLLWVTTCLVITGASIAGFYYYGKSSRNAMIDLNISQTTGQR